MKILKKIWAAIWPSSSKSSKSTTSTEATSSTPSKVVEFLKGKGFFDEKDEKFQTFKAIMEVQEDLRKITNANVDGTSTANKIEGMELDYKILSNLIHFDVIGVQPMLSKKGDVYYLDWDGPNNLIVVCGDLKAKSKELKAGLSMGADEDAMNLHGIDLKEEISQAVAMEIVQEKNAELIKAIKENCHTSKYKFKEVGKSLTRMEIQILLHKVRNSIAKKSRRGLGSYFIVPSKVLAIMHSFITTTADFEFVPYHQVGDPGLWRPSIQLAGWIRMGKEGRIPVYHDTMAADDNWILSGYRGDSQLDVGAVYAPYHLINFTYKMKETPAEIEGQLPLIDEVFVGRTRDDFFGPRKDYFHMVELDMTEIDKFFEELKKEAA